MQQDFSEHLLAFEAKKAHLLKELRASSQPSIRLQKKTASNLFRYGNQNKKNKRSIAIKHFDNIISIDHTNFILDVEGLTSYEKIVKYTLQYNLLPTVAPELKHITIGGAIVGIGIESSGYKYGFVHDGLIEAEVLLSDGQIIVCTAHNEHADLFFALPNSYGTLGYILRAKIKLYPAKPFVHLTSKKFTDPAEFLQVMYASMSDKNINFIEGLIFSAAEFYLMNSSFVSSAERVDDIYKKYIFYQLVRNKRDIFLSTEDYIFRYDPDWFWNIPATFIYTLFRKFAPRRFRNSGFYKKYIDLKKKLLSLFGVHSSITKQEEVLIQDWEVPWENGLELLNFALHNIDLQGNPWAALPIKALHSPTLYPLKADTIYFNLGCYCASKRKQNSDNPYENTKMMDIKCFSLQGIKMLYSSTFLSKEEFDSHYNGDMYIQLKNKYDKKILLGNLYDKVSYKIASYSS